MTKIKDTSIFQGIVEFVGPNTGTAFRFERRGRGIWARYARPAGHDGGYYYDGQVQLTRGPASPERLLAASDLD